MNGPGFPGPRRPASAGVLPDHLLWATGRRPPVGPRPSDPAGRLEADPEKVEQGLARLVLTLVELIRQLMERQALRRVDAGNLTEEQEERLGQGLLALSEKMAELKDTFGLTDEDLDLHLGPLRDLL